jgi:hypothetical protein
VEDWVERPDEEEDEEEVMVMEEGFLRCTDGEATGSG